MCPAEETTGFMKISTVIIFMIWSSEDTTAYLARISCILSCLDSLVLLKTTLVALWGRNSHKQSQETACFSANQLQKHRTKKQTQHQRTQTENQDKKQLTPSSYRTQNYQDLPRQQQSTRTTTGKWRTWMTRKPNMTNLHKFDQADCSGQKKSCTTR